MYDKISIRLHEGRLRINALEESAISRRSAIPKSMLKTYKDLCTKIYRDSKTTTLKEVSVWIDPIDHYDSHDEFFPVPVFTYSAGNRSATDESARTTSIAKSWDEHTCIVYDKITTVRTPLTKALTALRIPQKQIEEVLEIIRKDKIKKRSSYVVIELEELEQKNSGYFSSYTEYTIINKP